MRTADVTRTMDGMGPTDEMVSVVRSVLAHHMLEMCEDPVLVLNDAHRVVLASRSAAVFGRGLPALIGSAWSDLAHPDDARAIEFAPVGLDRRYSGVSHTIRVRGASGLWEAMTATTYVGWTVLAGSLTVVVLRPQR